MKSIFFAAIALLSMNFAMATGNTPNSNITNDVRTNAAAYVDVNNNTSVKTGDVSLSTGAVTSTNVAFGGSSNQSVTVTDSGKMEYSGSYSVKNVPDVTAPNVYPTSPCMGSSSIGGSGIGFGFSVGSSWTDDECGIRETARSFSGMNMKEDALAVLCSSKYAAVAPSCKKE